MGDQRVGVQPQLSDQTVGVGRSVGEQTSQGDTLRDYQSAGPSSASRQKADYPSSSRSSVLRVAGRCSADNACDGKRTPRLLIDPTTRQHLQRPDRDRWLRCCRQSPKTSDLTSTTGRTHLWKRGRPLTSRRRLPTDLNICPLTLCPKLGGGYWVALRVVWVPQCVVSDHDVEYGQELSHACSESNLFGFASIT